MKLNQTATMQQQIESHPDATTNHEGGRAFNIDARTRLYSRVTSCLVGEPKFYQTINEDGTCDVNQDKELIKDVAEVAKIDPEFVLQLAAYARNTLNLRTVSIVLLGEAALIDSTKKFVERYTPFIVRRADELAETVAYIRRKIGHLGSKAPRGCMPKALQRGLATAFHNFNEYSFAKYNRKGLVKLKDVVRLVHPRPIDTAESKLFKRILTDSLATPETWETEISGKGSTKENWEAIAPRMGYMALLRNLRNMLEKGVSAETMKAVLGRISDPEQVRKSKQLPFRFFSAYREIEKLGLPSTVKVLDALESAMDASVENLPRLPGRTLIIADHSGSMDNALSAHGTVTLKETADVLMAVAHKMCEEPLLCCFGETFRFFQASQRNGVLGNVKLINGVNVGGATYASLPMAQLAKDRQKVDRIILLSDMQCYSVPDYRDSARGFGSTGDSFAVEFEKYRRSLNPDVKLYSFDLAGYGTAQFPQNERNVCLLAGWSERVLEYIKIYEAAGTRAVELVKHGAKEILESPDEPGAGRADTRTSRPAARKAAPKRVASGSRRATGSSRKGAAKKRTSVLRPSVRKKK